MSSYRKRAVKRYEVITRKVYKECEKCKGLGLSRKTRTTNECVECKGYGGVVISERKEIREYYEI